MRRSRDFRFGDRRIDTVARYFGKIGGPQDRGLSGNLLVGDLSSPGVVVVAEGLIQRANPGIYILANGKYINAGLNDRPDPHALPPALLAARDLCEPAKAQLIKALMRSFLTAIGAELAELLGSVNQKHFPALGEVCEERPKSTRPSSVLCDYEIGPKGTTHTLLDRDGTVSIEKITEGKWMVAGTDGHRLLLRCSEGRASNMPAG